MPGGKRGIVKGIVVTTDTARTGLAISSHNHVVKTRTTINRIRVTTRTITNKTTINKIKVTTKANLARSHRYHNKTRIKTKTRGSKFKPNSLSTTKTLMRLKLRIL